MALLTRPVAVLAAFLLVLGVVALGEGSAQAASQRVVIKGYAYGPHAITINQGDTVTWTNQDTAPHDVVVTSGPVRFRSPMLKKGQSWTYRFTKAGSYSYICSVHPDMHGTATVKLVQQAQPAPVQARPTVQSAPTPTPRKARPAKQQPAAVPETPQTLQPEVASTTTSLDPLVLVMGASAAVVVFCLLLMASRPSARRTSET